MCTPSPAPVAGTHRMVLARRQLDPSRPSSRSRSFAEPQQQQEEDNADRRAPPQTTVLVREGDVLIEYAERSSRDSSSARVVVHRWQVASADLVSNSPYFRALLDPNKFSEGRRFLEQKEGARYSGASTNAANTTSTNNNNNTNTNQPFDGYTDQDRQRSRRLSGRQAALPIVSLKADVCARRPRAAAVELFLRILSLGSLPHDERPCFYSLLKRQPASLVSSLVDLADALNSPQAVVTALQLAGYSYGRKSKIAYAKFSDSCLKLSEDHIRQMLSIAFFLCDQPVVQTLTHSLVVLGSRVWTSPTCGSLAFGFFPAGVEEELFHRRQCVLNTITDLQASFLRAYGALEDSDSASRGKPHPSAPSSGSSGPRPYQCRRGLDSSGACDLFHLGQMTRFFALRSRTVFLGSTLIDPDFSLDPADGCAPSSSSSGNDPCSDCEHDGAADEPLQCTDPPASTAATAPGPPSDMLALVASLKQCPDYQIDASHSGCGIRRRLLPALDFIERFLGDSRALLGLKAGSALPAHQSWRSRALRRADVVELRQARIVAVQPASLALAQPDEEARLLFTATRRIWEA